MQKLAGQLFIKQISNKVINEITGKSGKFKVWSQNYNQWINSEYVSILIESNKGAPIEIESFKFLALAVYNYNISNIR